MEKNIYKITKPDLYDLFARLSTDYRVFVPYGKASLCSALPYAKGERLYFGEFNPEKESSIELGGIRQSQPLKSFINPPREREYKKWGESPPCGKQRSGDSPHFS